MPKEYTAIKNRFLKRGYSQKEAKSHSSRIFYSKYKITPSQSHKLWKQGKWDDYLIRKGFKKQMRCSYCAHTWIARIKGPRRCPRCGRELR